MKLGSKLGSAGKKKKVCERGNASGGQVRDRGKENILTRTLWRLLWDETMAMNLAEKRKFQE